MLLVLEVVDPVSGSFPIRIMILLAGSQLYRHVPVPVANQLPYQRQIRWIPKLNELHVGRNPFPILERLLDLDLAYK